MAGAFDRLSGEQCQILAEQQQQARVIERSAHQRIQQGARSGAIFSGEHGCQQFHAPQGRLNAQEVIDQRRAHPGILHVQVHLLELVATANDGLPEGLRIDPRRLRRHKLFGEEHQLVERRGMDVAGAAVTNGRGRAAPGDARSEQPQRLTQILLQRQGGIGFPGLPQQLCHLREILGRQGVKAFDRPAARENADEQQPRIGIGAGAGHEPREDAAPHFREQTRLSGKARIRKQRHRMQFPQQLQPRLAKTLVEHRIERHELQPAGEPRGHFLVTDLGHDEGEQASRSP